MVVRLLNDVNNVFLSKRCKKYEELDLMDEI
jgi:hypothetical protein